MALNIPRVSNIFPHSREFEQGIGTRGIRKGEAATFIVALDGSGDFDNIQEAIDALPSTGGNVFIKEGTYSISSSITIQQSYTSIFGAGFATKIRTTGDVPMIDLNTKAWITLRDFQLYGSGSGNSNNVGIYEDNAGGELRLQNLHIENTGAEAVNVRQMLTHGDIDNCRIVAPFSTGVRLELCYNFSIRNTEIINVSSGHGVHYIKSKQNHIIGCKIYNVYYHGIFFEKDGTSPSSENIVSSCLIRDADFDDTGNYDGVHLGDLTDQCIINNNRIWDGGNYGIEIETVNCDENMISNNILDNNSAGAINDQGTGTVLDNNISS